MKEARSNLTNSPFRYAGGKFYARKLILENIPVSRVYCEPFAGGASIFFAKKPSVVSILNDLDLDVMNTFRQIRDNLDGLLDLLKGVEATKENHAYFKNDYQPSNKLERAFRWYFLNRTSYSGIMKHENCYWGYHEKYSMRVENWPRHLRTVSERLQNVLLSSVDFEECIEALPPNSFCFVDPPYFEADQKKFYPCHFDNSDHLRLSECLKAHSSRINFLVTYDNCPEIHEMYSWCSVIEEQEWQYTINRTDNQKAGKKLADGYRSERKKGKEVFIGNFDKETFALAGQAKLVAAQ